MKSPSFLVLACAIFGFSQPSCLTQENAARRYEMATNQLRQVAREISAVCLTNVEGLADWKTQRPVLHRELMETLGLHPFPARTPLNTQITGVVNREHYRIEKLVFQSMPGLYVTGNFYVPKGVQEPLPTILYLCGHAPHPFGAKVHYQDRAAWFASHGFACLILDTLEFGEVAGIHHGTHDLNMWHWLSLGYTPAGTEVWNGMRALDYLETRKEVDRNRIGVTGISGGGAITWYLAAADDRVSVAAPVCSTYTFGSQATDWRASGQCDCIYFPNMFQRDFPVVAALIAPRPLLMISGRKDLDFPPSGYHEVFRRSKRIYDLYASGDSDRVQELDDEVGHSDPPQFLRGARNWMKRWLQESVTDAGGERPFEPELAENLRCLANLPKDARNYRIQNELTRPIVVKKTPSRTEWEVQRKSVMTALSERVFRWFPTATIPFETKSSSNSAGWVPRYADYKEITFQTEVGARIRCQLLRPKGDAGDAPLLIHVKRPGDSIYFMDMDEMLPLLGRAAVLVLNPRFTEIPPAPADYAAIEMTASWCGRTIAGMQVWDVLRAVKWALEEEKLKPSSISVYGKTHMGIVGLYAALLDSRIQQVILNDPPVSHWQNPALLGVLRVTDIPEAAAMLAPRRLVCTTRWPLDFGFTRAIFKEQGVPYQFAQTGSLPESLVLSP